MDIIGDLAYPLPVIVIAELLGIPTADRERFKRWSDGVVGDSEMDNYTAQQEMGLYFASLLAQRRRDPQDDLLSALLEASVDGQKLSLEELLGFCIILLVAGNITTTNLIGNTFLCFDEYPAALEQLYADSALLSSAIEEVLRYRSPVRQMYRLCVKDTELSSQLIPAGDFVTAWIGSANRDEDEFPNADVFEITRSPNRHIAFGHGIHYCLGAPLARLEAKIALGVMLERFSNIRRVADVPLVHVTGSILHGVLSLPITFSST
jgi:cytochrome P450